MTRHIALEFSVDGLADRRHRRQRKQLIVEDRRGHGSRSRDEWTQAESHTVEAVRRVLTQIEFAQCVGIGDGGTAFQRRALRRARRQDATKDEDDNNKSQCAAHILTNPAQQAPFRPGQHSYCRKIAEKETGCLAAIGYSKMMASRRGEASEHDPEKREPVFLRDERGSVCPEILSGRQSSLCW